MIWLLRAARWVRHPPSERRVMLVAAVVAICFAIWGLEQLVGFPEWLEPKRLPRR